MESLEKIKRAGRWWHCRFQGGEIQINLSDTSTLMFYGRSGSVPVDFLADAADSRACIIIHHRHARAPMMLIPTGRTGAEDVATAQILCRENARRRLVIAKACVMARMQQSRWLVPVPDSELRLVRSSRSLASVRGHEAAHARRYWESYYKRLGMPGHRRDGGEVAAALDALSHFLQAVLLRWVVLHRLLPSHGYLHEPVAYNALLYDLMEPVRHWMEQALAHECAIDQGNLAARSTVRLKVLLEQQVEIPALQAQASRKSILHGMVLALRAYLLGEMRTLVFPLDDEYRRRGRPLQVTYRVPGQKKRSR